MREQYPFFREEDERTRAVIGADAAEADLGGEYQKPYAILTQKRLYCKNEAGNFITQSADLRGVGKSFPPELTQWFWAEVVCMVLLVCMVIFYHFAPWGHNNLNNYYSVVGSRTQMPASAYFDLLVSVLLCLECVIAYIFIFQKSFTVAHRLVSVAIITALAYSIFLCSKRLLDHSLTGWTGVSFDDVFLPLMSLVAIISFVLSVINSWHSKRNVTFQITHNAGALSFNPRLYSSAELKHFAAQVKALKAGDTNGQ